MTAFSRWSRLVALSIPLTLACSSGLLGDDAVRARLVKEAPEGWKRIGRLTEHLQMTQTKFGEDRSNGESESQLKICGNNFLYVSNEEAYGRNERYSFQLRRASAKLPWQVRRYGKTPDAGLEYFFDLLLVEQMMLPQLSVATAFLPEIFEHKTFVIKEVASVERGDQSMVQLSFEYAPPGPDKPRFWPSRGQIILDPNQCWAVSELEVEQTRANDTTWKWSQKNRLRSAPDDLALLDSYEQVVYIPEQPKTVIHMEVRDVDTGKISESDFLLSALGLPELSPELMSRLFRGVERFFGKRPPELAITDARGVPKNVKLADFHGKWVLLDFWGLRCMPCINEGLPNLSRFYEEHKTDRDRFEILAICNNWNDEVKTMEEFDLLVSPIVDAKWGGKQLPFPVLIDGEGKTFQAYGVGGVPRTLLIDPDGNLVNGGEEMLAEKLKEKRR